MTTPSSSTHHPTTGFYRQPKAESFLGPDILIDTNVTSSEQRRRRIFSKTQTLISAGFSSRHMSGFHSLLRTTNQNMDRLHAILAAGANVQQFMVDYEQSLEETGAIRRCDALTADSPLRMDRRPHRIRHDDAPLPPDMVGGMEMNQRLLALRRETPMVWQGVPARRGRVHRFLTTAQLADYIPTLERGLVGPFFKEHLSVDSFPKRHRQLLEAGRDDRTVNLDARRGNDLIFALSYRHQPKEDRRFPKDRLSLSDTAKLQDILLFIWHQTPRANDDVGIFFWQDQMAKGEMQDNDLDWVNTGVMPYMILPVIKIVSCHGAASDEGRLWLSCERMLAENGLGALVKARFGEGHENHVSASSPPLPEVLRRFARTVVGGFLEGKEVSWYEDFLRLNHWAVDVLLCDSWEKCVRFINRESVKTDIQSNRRLRRSDMEQLLYMYSDYQHLTMPGRRLRIREREGLRKNWSDHLVIIESCGGETEGGISAPMDDNYSSDRIIAGGYEVCSDENFRYFVRIPRTGFSSTEIVTGKVSKCEDTSDGHVIEVIKTQVLDLFSVVQEFARDVALLYKSEEYMQSVSVYVDGTKEFFETSCLRIVEAIWNPGKLNYEGSMDPADAAWD